MSEAVVEADEKERKTRRPRGTGRVFLQKDKKTGKLRSPFYYVQYYRNGIRYIENSRSARKWQAEKFLQKRLAEVSTGNFLGPAIERITVAELADDLLRKYRNGEIKGKDSLEWSERRWKLHLAPFFGCQWNEERKQWVGGVRAAQVGSDLISRYIEERQHQGAENSTINRELSFVKRAYNVGRKANPPKVYRVPPIPRLEEDNVRHGFLKDADYDKLAQECAKEGLWLRALLAVAHNFGWRKGEVLSLRVNQVDLPSRTIRLEVGETKNNEGRTVKMTKEVETLLTACIQGKGPDDYVFTREDGRRIRDFRKLWQAVCVRAGVGTIVCRHCWEAAIDHAKRANLPRPSTNSYRLGDKGKCPKCRHSDKKYVGLIVHDLRRTGARNLRRLGIGQNTIMKIGGWKTDSVFHRYDIVSEADLDDAARALDRKQEERKQQRVDSTSTLNAQSTVQSQAPVANHPQPS